MWSKRKEIAKKDGYKPIRVTQSVLSWTVQYTKSNLIDQPNAFVNNQLKQIATNFLSTKNEFIL